MTVERILSDEHITGGWIQLSQREADELDLPRFSSHTKVQADHETFDSGWNASSRRVSGESLMDYLQLHAQAGWLVRLSPTAGGQLKLHVVERSASSIGRPRVHGMKPSKPRPEKDKTKSRRRRDNRRPSRYRLRDRAEYEWTASIGIHKEAVESLLGAVRHKGWDNEKLADLRLEGERLAAVDQFEQLMSVDVARVDRMPHQEAAARKLLSQMSGRGILADEVGLGKTIEAGLVLKELQLRGLIDRMLILCPAPLRHQWQEEMLEKFDLPFEIIAKGGELSKARDANSIMTTHLAIRNHDFIKDNVFDVIVVDEAHKAKGKLTAAVISELSSQARYVLFLTATPVQNDLLELYSLVETLRPGTFESKNQFRKRYTERNDKRRPKNPEALRRLVSDVIIRTTRGQAGLDRVTRITKDVPITLHPQEQRIYEMCLNGLRRVLNGPYDVHRRRALALRLTTSPNALAESALRIAKSPTTNAEAAQFLTEIAHLCGEIDGSTRERVALKLTKDWVKEHGRVLLFTQHTATINSLTQFFSAAGLSVGVFHGDMSHEARRRSVADFKRGDIAVLLSSDAGAEGQNLQFCNCVINYDLPWNPMRIEQRIGRVDRMSQPRDEVFVANLFARNTIDEDVYRLLHQKLAMFELLFGQVTTILGELDDSEGTTFESRVLNALMDLDDDRMRQRLDRFGAQLETARSEADAAIRSDSGLSDWLASERPFDHRLSMTEAADELVPTAITPGNRQAEVQSWVRRLLQSQHSQISYESESFLSASISGRMADELRSSELHLAFRRDGLETHPEAELCAVGSEIFDMILESLRHEGALVGYVAFDPSSVPLPPPTKVAKGSELVLRNQRIRFGGLRGCVHGRLQLGDGLQRVISIPFNNGLPPEDELRAFTELGSDDDLSRKAAIDLGETLGGMSDGIATAVIKELEPIALEQNLAANEAAGAKNRSLASNLRSRLTGLSIALNPEERTQQARLQSQIDLLEAEMTTASAELRFDAVQLRVVIGEESILSESFVDSDGNCCEIHRSVSADGLRFGPPITTEGVEIDQLAICSSGHIQDLSTLFSCEECESFVCSSCDESSQLRPCAVCEHLVCGHCSPHSVCRKCLAIPCDPLAVDDPLVELCNLINVPVRRLKTPAGELVLLRWGDRLEAIMINSKGQVDLWADLSAGDFPRILHHTQREFAEAVFLEVHQAATEALPRGVTLAKYTSFLIETRIKPSVGKGRSERSVQLSNLDLPAIDQTFVGSDDSDRGLPGRVESEQADRLTNLTNQFAWPTPPAFTVVEVEIEPHVHGVVLSESGLHSLSQEGTAIEVSIASFDEAIIESPLTARFRPAPQRVRTAEILGQKVSIVEHGRSVWMALERPGEEVLWIRYDVYEKEEARLTIAKSIGVSGIADISVAQPIKTLQLVSIENRTLAHRRITPVVQSSAEVAGPIDPVVATQLLGLGISSVPKHGTGSIAIELETAMRHRLDIRAEAISYHVVDIAYEIEELWEGEPTIKRQYRFDPGMTAGFVDTHVGTKPTTDTFWACSQGHLATAVAECADCKTIACSACHEIVRSCSICGAAVCSSHAEPSGAVCIGCARLRPADRKDGRLFGLKVRWPKRVEVSETPERLVARIRGGAGRTQIFQRFLGDPPGEWKETDDRTPLVDSRVLPANRRNRMNEPDSHTPLTVLPPRLELARQHPKNPSLVPPARQKTTEEADRPILLDPTQPATPRRSLPDIHTDAAVTYYSLLYRKGAEVVLWISPGNVILDALLRGNIGIAKAFERSQRDAEAVQCRVGDDWIAILKNKDPWRRNATVHLLSTGPVHSISELLDAAKDQPLATWSQYRRAEG